MSSSSISEKPANNVEHLNSPEAYSDHESETTPAAVAVPQVSKTKYLTSAFLCCMIAFGGFVFGWDTGTISGFVNMPEFIHRFGQISGNGAYYLSKSRTGLMVSIFNIGCAIGGVTIGRTGDMYGRKIGLMITMVVYIVGIIIQIASVKSWVQYFIGRIISGLGVGAVSVLAPMFISETSPKAIRGTLVSFYQLMITLGIFLGYCSTYGTFHGYDDSRQWRIPLGLSFAWALLMIVGMTFTPESPRFLIEKGRLEEAAASLAKINKVEQDSDFIKNEMEVLVAAIELEQNAGSATWGELFTGKPKIFYRLMVGVLLQSLQQLTGNNYFFYYGTTIFQSVGLNDSFETSIVFGVINFASTFVALYVVDKFGRRKTLLGGAAGMLLCLVIFASIGVKDLYIDGYGSEARKPVGNAMIFLVCFFIFFFATTWGPCVFVVVSETYPLRIRSKGMAIASGANWIWGFLIAFFTPFITGAIHFAYGYVFFGCVIFAFFFVFAFVPETKGLSLEDVDELYSNYTPGLAFMSSWKKNKLQDKQEDLINDQNV
ncbi:hexose transporter hxt1 [Pichia californica]|uniref:Hexose transporter hxt1 n=1 Tax=Pichia californica TaxID=460514 RepID=A0A9P6WM85_9ASCO|nr:hexose transporter hxt1 [[Candida] californica]KAG0689706.1 hexose transporter hxt1 [[Candida] californica]